MEIIVPGTPVEFDRLFRASWGNGSPTYYRLSERSNRTTCEVEFGRAYIVQKGEAGVVIAVGPTLSDVLAATTDLDVTILYYTTLEPFDRETLSDNCPHRRIVVVEPFYEGTLAWDIQMAMGKRPYQIKQMGVPRQFLTHYGKASEHDVSCGLTAEHLRRRFREFLNE
jgi:transketolase